MIKVKRNNENETKHPRTSPCTSSSRISRLPSIRQYDEKILVYEYSSAFCPLYFRCRRKKGKKEKALSLTCSLILKHPCPNAYSSNFEPISEKNGNNMLHRNIILSWKSTFANYPLTLSLHSSEKRNHRKDQHLLIVLLHYSSVPLGNVGRSKLPCNS